VQRLTETLAVQARRDHLTGLLNRLGLAELLPEVAASGGMLGVLCLDVDGFKRINDELGHAAGDSVLVEIAGRLAGSAEGGAIAARLGGDEFAVLVPGAGADVVQDLAEELRAALTGTAGVLALPWTVSIGTAMGRPHDVQDVERLLASADLAMYDDKQRRRPRVDLAPPRRETPTASA
jgi:diguanylate cyclase (GGDEF)-like protein